MKSIHVFPVLIDMFETGRVSFSMLLLNPIALGYSVDKVGTEVDVEAFRRLSIFDESRTGYPVSAYGLIVTELPKAASTFRS